MVTAVKPAASEARERQPRRARGPGWSWAGVIAFAAVIVSWLVFAAVNGALNEVDLTVYRDGGLIVRHVRPYYDPSAYAPLYDWGGYSSLALKFTYTPFAAIAFAGVSLLPWAVSEFGSVVVNMAALVAALWFTFGGLGYRDRRVRLGATLLAAAATFWLQPVIRTIYLGQINLILMAAIMWDLCQPDLTASGRRRWWKGAVTGVAAGIKLVPLIFVPYLLVTRRFREAVATLWRVRRHRRRRVRRPAARLLAVVAARHVPVRRQQDRVHGLGGQPVAARDHHQVRRVRRGRAGPVDRRRAHRARRRHDRRLPAQPGRVPRARAARDRADRPARLPGELGSPLGLDRPRGRGDRALRVSRAARRRGARWTARRLWALIAGMIFFFAAWPDAIWESARTLGNLSLGFLWAQANTNPVEFAQRGDQPGYVEYHWHGFQLLWGNTYILAGVALLLIALWTGFRLRNRPAAAEVAEQEPLTATIS